MFIDRPATDPENLADLPGGLAERHPRQDLPLPSRKVWLLLRTRAMQLKHSVKRIKRHEMKRRQIVVRPIKCATAQPYVPRSARSRADRYDETVRQAKVHRTLYNFERARLSLAIIGSFLEPICRVEPSSCSGGSKDPRAQIAFPGDEFNRAASGISIDR